MGDPARPPADPAAAAAPRRQKKTRSTPAAVAAAKEGDLVALRALPVQEVRDAHDHNGCGCLHWAAGDGRLELCQFLVEEAGVSVEVLTWNRRTPLHYASRNGRLEVCRWLVEVAGAAADAMARDEVSPFQMAAWQNHLEVCRWLAEKGVDAKQVNRFSCTAGHWLALAPADRAGPEGADLLPLARWLREGGVDFAVRQEQGHNALHKAAWAGHLALCQWLRDECGLLDGWQDNAGNYAADLAEQAGHGGVAAWLRAACSGSKAESCAVLGVPVDASPARVRAAYLRRVRLAHPDLAGRAAGDRPDGAADAADEFNALHQAYRHLTVEGGAGQQRNPKHIVQLMLMPPGGAAEEPCPAEEQAPPPPAETGDLQTFKARLLAVVADFGDKGFPLSLLRRRYAQVWRGCPFPTPADFGINKRSMGLAELLQTVAPDAVRLETFGDGRQPLVHALSSAPAAAHQEASKA